MFLSTLYGWCLNALQKKSRSCRKRIPTWIIWSSPVRSVHKRLRNNIEMIPRVTAPPFKSKPLLISRKTPCFVLPKSWSCHSKVAADINSNQFRQHFTSASVLWIAQVYCRLILLSGKIPVMILCCFPSTSSPVVLCSQKSSSPCLSCKKTSWFNVFCYLKPILLFSNNCHSLSVYFFEPVLYKLLRCMKIPVDKQFQQNDVS